MVRRDLLHNLPQLQNYIKRDPESYHEEFIEQKKAFESTIKTFELMPEIYNKSLDELTNFMAQISKCYQKEMVEFPNQIIDLLNKHNAVLDNSMRMCFCKALVLLRNKDLLQPMELLKLFFNLLRCNDKNLRTFLKINLVTDIKNLNKKHKNVALNTQLQNFMFTMLRDSNKRAAKMSLDIMIELYWKNIWKDAKTVNVIVTGCFSDIAKIMVASMKFFLSKDEEEKKDDSDSSDDEVDLQEVMMKNKFNKSSKKRDKMLKKAKKLTVKAQKKKKPTPDDNLGAIYLIHDPQGMAEKLFRQLDKKTKRFEIRLMTLDVISRLIGVHKLMLFNFYPYIQRFLQPHQREVTRILLFAARASHDLVPPDVMESVLNTIADKFISEHNSSDVMAIGLNAVREICANAPLAMSPALMSDLAEFKNYRDRSVMMAACSLISLFRRTRPELLAKKFRGRPNDATQEIVSRQYAELDAKDFIPGAEVLLKEQEKPSSDVEINSESGSDDEQWIDVNSDDDDNTKCDETLESEEADDEEEEEDEEEEQGEDGEKAEGEKKLTKKEKAQNILVDRILTDEDFKRIEAENIRKQVQYTSKGQKRKLEEESAGIVRLGDIENIYKKRKHDKQTRVDSVRAGQEDREKFGYRDRRVNAHCSTTNREKRKHKNFQMLKYKAKGKVKRSFKDKQIALRNYLLHQKRMK